MPVTEIAFSCYPVTNMARARAFYEGILDPDANTLCIHQRNPGHH